MEEVTGLHRKSLLTAEVEQQLAHISEATVTRLLRKHRSRKQHFIRDARIHPIFEEGENRNHGRSK